MESLELGGSNVVVVVDRRERDGGLLALLRARWPRTVEGLLPVGDVGIGPRVLVERKTLTDLAVSIADGRLFRQAFDLAGRAERPLIVIEGTFDPVAMEQTGLTAHGYRGVLLSLMTGYGIPVLRTRSVQETAAWLALLAGQETRRGRRPGRRRTVHAARDPQAAMLAALPGIGPARAERLLEEFGTVRDVFEADPKRLRRVQGVGNALATFLASLGGPRGRRRPAEGNRPGRTDGVAEGATLYAPKPARRGSRTGGRVRDPSPSCDSRSCVVASAMRAVARPFHSGEGTMPHPLRQVPERPRILAPEYGVVAALSRRGVVRMK